MLGARSLGLRPRWSVYGGLIGVVTAALLAGFALPLILGHRPPDTIATTSLAVTPGGLGGSATTATAASGTAPGPATGPAATASAPTGPGAVLWSGTSNPAAVTTASAGTGLSATDTGVTATSIVFGVLVPDLGALAAAGVGGLPTAATIESQWRNYVNLVNGAGGILGRKIDVRFATYNILGGSDPSIAACTQVTQGDKSFVVGNSGGYYDPLCVVQDNKTPMFNYIGSPDDFYAQNPGRLWTLVPRASREMSNWVRAMDRSGLLHGHRVGVLSDTYPEGIITTDDYLIPIMKQAGAAPVHHSEISYDTATAQSQVPVEVKKMMDAKADVVMITANGLTAGQYLQQAQNDGYHPQWVVSDYEQNTLNAAGSQMGSDFDGAIGFTSTRNGDAIAGAPEAAYDRSCRERGEPSAARDGVDYFFALAACTIVDRFVAAARAVGPNLTRAAFESALAHTGRFDNAWFGSGSWSASKPDAADGLRRIRYSASCSCFRLIDAAFSPTS